jgi:AraC-like DNA-binding protein
MRVCSTSALPTHERFAFWADVVASTFVKLDCEAPRRDHFFGTVRHRAIGRAEIVDVFADAQKATRSPTALALDASDSLIINLQVQGNCIIETAERDTSIGVGQCAVIETREPYRLTFPQRFRQVVLKLPRSIVDMRSLRLHGAAVRPSTARLLFQMSDWALKELDAVGDEEAQAFETSVSEVLRSGLGGEEFPAVGDAPTEARYRQAIDFIEGNLEKASLNSGRLARELGTSVRSLTRLFRLHGTTVEQFIWQRRLDATRHDLLDGRLAHRTITEIAFARGFSDLSHFSRRFTQAYGQSPRTFRARDTK